MPTVPAYNNGAPTEQPRPIQQAEMNPAVAAQGARQLGELGQAVGSLGEVGANIQIKMQEQANLDTVFRAETQVKTNETAFHNEIRGLEGENAKEATKRAIEFWGKQEKDAGDLLTNDPQRRAFQKILSDRRNASLDYVSQHEAQQTKRAAEDAADASVKASIEDIIANPASAKLNTVSITNTLRALGKVHGQAPETIANQILTATTAAHKGVIDSMVDANAGGARAYYNAHKDEIAPHARGAIESALRVGGVKQFSLNKAAEIGAMFGGDLKQQLDYVDKNIKDADNHDAVTARLVANFNRNDALTRQQQNDNYQQTLKVMAVSKPGQFGLSNTDVVTAADLPAALREGMSGEQLMHVNDILEKRRTGTPVRTDPASYLDVSNRINRGEQVNLLEYETKLSTEDIKALDAQQTKPAKDLVTLDQQLAPVFSQLNIKKDSEDAANLQRAVVQAVTTERDVLGRELRDTERQAIIDRMVIKNDSWFGGKRYYETLGTPDQATFKAGDPTQQPANVPEAERAAIIAAFQRKGRKSPLTETEIQEAYDRRNGATQ